MNKLNPIRSMFRHGKLFWRIALMIVLTNLVIVLGAGIAGTFIFRRIEEEMGQTSPELVTLWQSQLMNHYVTNGSWDNVDKLVESYPQSEAWDDMELNWSFPFYLTDEDNIIIYTTVPERLGTQLHRMERTMATTIEVNNEIVGKFLLIPNPFLVNESGQAISPENATQTVDNNFATTMQNGLRNLLIAEAVIFTIGIIGGIAGSRRISKPIESFTQASQDIATGDFSTRMPASRTNEFNVIAQSFNDMAADLEESDELRRNMTADVAHELRTPLSVIRGKLEGILDGVYPASPEQLEPVLAQTEMLTRLVEDLRVLALAEAHQLPMDMSTFDVGDMLRDIQVNFEPIAGDKDVSIELELANDLPSICGDQRRIAQVIINLVTNAIRYSDAGDTITLSAQHDSDGVTLEVSDTGRGIPEEDLPHIFNRFWRGEKSRNRAQGGSGLGLAISQELVKLHGSEITVTSEVGRGSRFCFSLPSEA